MTRARYSIIRQTKDIVFIKDDFDSRNPSMTVTNDAEAVVQELLKEHATKFIICKDTEGDWAILQHDGKKFLGFKPVNVGMFQHANS